MQNQNELKCDGCGQQFSNRNDLEKHRQTCAAVRTKAGSAQQQRSSPVRKARAAVTIPSDS